MLPTVSFEQPTVALTKEEQEMSKMRKREYINEKKHKEKEYKTRKSRKLYKNKEGNYATE